MTVATALTRPPATSARAPLALGRPRFRDNANGTPAGRARGSVPATEYKLKGLKLRWFFKKALRGFLPDEILAKKKQGLALPFGVWANRHVGLKRFATNSLQSLAQRGIVQPAFIDALLKDLLAAHPGYYDEMVWVLMLLEQWMRGGAARQPA